MYAAREGHSTLGIPASVGREFINASHGRLPKRKKKSALQRAREMIHGR